MMAGQSILQKTPLHAQHQKLGAKLVEFGGWEMPLQYTKVMDEHHSVRQNAGLFDVSHMGLFAVRSGDVKKTIVAFNHLVPQDLTKLVPGKALYTQFTNEQGGTVDDIIVYWMPETSGFPELTELLVIVNAATTEKDRQWMRSHLPKEIELEYLNDRYGFMALQGPKFMEVMAMLGIPSPAGYPKRFNIAQFDMLGTQVLISRTGYTGEDGIEIIVPVAHVERVWMEILGKGEPYGVKPCGLAARDTLRLEAAYPLYGHELSDDISPLEAGLEWSVKLEKEADFIGKAALKAQKEHGLSKVFVCLKMLDKAIPRQGDLLYDEGGNPLGSVTSGSISPTLGVPVGVGFVDGSRVPTEGTAVQVEIRNKRVPAVIVKRPFYSRKD